MLTRKNGKRTNALLSSSNRHKDQAFISLASMLSKPRLTMKTEDIQTIEREIEAAIENCIKLEKHSPRALKKRVIVFDLREILKRKRVYPSLKDHAVSFVMSRNITVNDTSDSGMIHCTIDFNSVVFNPPNQSVINHA